VTFQDLKERVAKKKPGRMDVFGASDSGNAALQRWTQAGWRITQRKGTSETELAAWVDAARNKQTDVMCIIGEEPLRTVRALERALPIESGPLTWLHGFQVAAYPKVLWTGTTPSVRYESVAEALKAVQAMIRALNAFGEAEPRVALLSCVEAISPGVPSTIWEAVLGHMGTRGQFGKAKVDGPMGLDLAVSPHSAEEKKFKSEIGAQADLIVPPDLNTFLTLADAIFLTGPQEAADVVMGGPCPIVLTPPESGEHAEFSLAAASLLRPE
jgi:hypothetical protein